MLQRLAELYSWETSEKLIWLEAKLSSQAARAFEVIDEDTKKDFDGVVEILTRRFEPESRQLLYQEKRFAYQRKGGEDWATVAENIKELAARAHPSSDGLAEGFALSRFLTLLEEDADLAVGVRRSAPKTLDEAVREATRLDSINQTVKKPKAVNPVEAAGTMAVSMQQVLNGISELKVSQEDNFSSMRCLEKATNSQADNGKRERGQRVSCFKCGRPGHIAKYCRGVKGVNNNYNYHCEKEGFVQNTAPRILTVPSVKINNCFISGYLGNRPICYLLDTGADVSVVRQDIWEEAEGCELVPWSGQE